ncbi:MAG: NADH-quinone oxidoreductase subunit NuoE [Rhodospirillales bacterium]
MPERPGYEDFQPEDFVFSRENLAEAEKIIAKYPAHFKSGACMPLLTMAQRQHNGWLPRAAMDYVADMLNMPHIRVYEVATFYTMYNRKPVGRHFVQVCTNLPCWLRGSDMVMATCRNRLKIEPGETTEDGLFTLAEVECLGACVNAPMMQINDDYYEDLDEGSANTLLNMLARGETPAPGPQNGRKGCEPATGATALTEDMRALKKQKVWADRKTQKTAKAGEGAQ